MARFLVKANDSYQHPDSATRAQFGFFKGDIIGVFVDGHDFGEKETLPNFIVIDCPGVKTSAFAHLAKQQPNPVSVEPSMLKQRRYQFSAALVDRAISLGGALVATRNEIVGNVIDKSA